MTTKNSSQHVDGCEVKRVVPAIQCHSWLFCTAHVHLLTSPQAPQHNADGQYIRQSAGSAAASSRRLAPSSHGALRTSALGATAVDRVCLLSTPLAPPAAPTPSPDRTPSCMPRTTAHSWHERLAVAGVCSAMSCCTHAFDCVQSPTWETSQSYFAAAAAAAAAVVVIFTVDHDDNHHLHDDDQHPPLLQRAMLAAGSAVSADVHRHPHPHPPHSPAHPQRALQAAGSAVSADVLHKRYGEDTHQRLDDFGAEAAELRVQVRPPATLPLTRLESSHHLHLTAQTAMHPLARFLAARPPAQTHTHTHTHTHTPCSWSGKRRNGWKHSVQQSMPSMLQSSAH
jgi:hypothetical protein